MNFLKFLCLLVTAMQLPVIFGTESMATKENTYKGEPITIENLLQIAPQVPDDINGAVRFLLEKNVQLTKDITGVEVWNAFTAFANNPNPMTHNQFQMAYQGYNARRAQLKALGINKSDFNYVIAILNDNWFIKASGLTNRFANVVAQVGGNGLGPLQFKQFINERPGVTYQTISRLPRWLRIKEAIEKFNLTHIGLPHMYLVHIPSRPLDVNDMNYVIVEENIRGKHLDETTMEQDPEVMRQKNIMVTYADLWDNGPKNFIVKDNKVYPIDTEQPNNIAPNKFLL